MIQPRMKMKIVGPILLIVYVNILPFICRLYRGFDWVTKYLPGEDHFFSGLLFLGVFASLPAIPLVIFFLMWKRLKITFIVSLIVATGFLVLWHHDYDLASDAQAAIGLIFIPIYTFILTIIAGGIVAIFELIIRKRKELTKMNSRATSDHMPSGYF